ncbi:MAG: hypothetical protein WA634_18790 [Silvibacterium sp.]
MKENYDEKIDRTLRLLGSATPAPGMEDRVVARLERTRAIAKAPRFFTLPQLALGMTAGVMACALIVAGSVSHSRHILPIAPGLHLPGESQPGVGAASAAHVAQQPVTTLPQDRPRSVREATNGRAVISSHAKKPTGIAVPKTLPSQD